jgi:predicted enzyme related to lactoylglutathione lyase
MGQPVVHFEVVGKDGPALWSFYSDLFGWEIDTNNPMNYGIVQREGNTSPDGTGIGGGVGQAPEGYTGHVTFYTEVPDVEAALQSREPRRVARHGPGTDHTGGRAGPVQ